MTALTQTLARLVTAPVLAPARAQAAEAIAAVTTAAAQGTAHPAVTALSEVASTLGTPPEAPVPGTTARYAAPWSAYLTATAAASGAGTGAGYAVVVVPAALAVGAEQGRGDDAVAEAVAVGMDVAGRLDAELGAALGPFEPVAAIGRLGGVAAAGRLLGLSDTEAAHAYGVAGTQAAGFAAVAAEPAGPLQIGKAAADAVAAAYLARAGYTAGHTGIEGRRGFAALLAPSADLTS